MQKTRLRAHGRRHRRRVFVIQPVETKPSYHKDRADGQTQKKSKNKNTSPIPFVKITKATGKKKRQLKTKLIKALAADTGASESITSLEAAKGLPPSAKTETKPWTAAAGILNTSAKTKRLELSSPELQANRKIDKSFHIVDVPLKTTK